MRRVASKILFCPTYSHFSDLYTKFLPRRASYISTGVSAPQTLLFHLIRKYKSDGSTTKSRITRWQGSWQWSWWCKKAAKETEEKARHDALVAMFLAEIRAENAKKAAMQNEESSRNWGWIWFPFGGKRKRKQHLEAVVAVYCSLSYLLTFVQRIVCVSRNHMYHLSSKQSNNQRARGIIVRQCIPRWLCCVASWHVTH